MHMFIESIQNCIDQQKSVPVNVEHDTHRTMLDAKAISF